MSTTSKTAQGKPASSKVKATTKPASGKPAAKTPKPKRYAFDPLAAKMAPPPRSAMISAPPAPAGADAEPERIDLVPVDMILPDFWQGRRPLPEAIRTRFWEGEIGAEQAVREWVQLAETDTAARARIEEYRVLARSLSTHEQINPSSVVRIPPTALGFRYRIESGERRYWAALINIVENGAKDRTLKVIIRDSFSARRQAEENSTQLALGAVELARTVARTLLDELKITPENAPIEKLAPGSNAFYRLALEPASKLLGAGHERFGRGVWPVVETTMGRTRQALERLLRILTLSDDVLEIADAYGLTERVLREVLDAGVPVDRQFQVAMVVGQLRLSSAYVRRLCAAEDFNSEVVRIKQELGGSEASDETGLPVAPATGSVSGKTAAKPHRATPAKRPLGNQFADRLGGLRKTVVGLSKGQAMSEADAVRLLVDDAMKVKPSEAQGWLTILEPLVEHLRALSHQSDETGHQS